MQYTGIHFGLWSISCKHLIIIYTPDNLHTIYKQSDTLQSYCNWKRNLLLCDSTYIHMQCAESAKHTTTNQVGTSYQDCLKSTSEVQIWNSETDLVLLKPSWPVILYLPLFLPKDHHRQRDINQTKKWKCQLLCS